MPNSDAALSPADRTHNGAVAGDGNDQSTPLSVRLVTDNRDLLERACTARFMAEVRSRALSLPVFRTYLAIERRFVVESARLLAAAALWSPDEPTLIQHVYAANHLVHDQLQYFSETLQRMGDSRPVSEAATDKAGELARLAREVVASGEYWRLVVLSYATENMYLKWCEATLPAVEPTTEIGRWVAMHTTTEFRARVGYLAGELDRSTPDGAVAEANQLYRDVIEAEIGFHEAPYADESTSRGPESTTRIAPHD